MRVNRTRNLARILGSVDSINERIGKVVSLGVVLMMLIILYEVTARYVFNRPTLWGHETSAMMFGVYLMFGTVYTLCRRTKAKHIKMDLFYARFSLRKKAIVDMVASGCLFIFAGTVIWQGVAMALRSTQLREGTASVWNPPIYPLKWLLPIGISLMLVMGVVILIRNITTAISGREDV